jgi:hypothetical protein
MANWNKIVESHNRQNFKWPTGWDSRETVAEQLECSPERVTEQLSGAIKNGEVEKKLITYWDDALKRKVSSFGYRPISKVETKSQQLSSTIKWPPAEGIRVSRRDNPKSKGTHIGKGKIQWDNGYVTQPKGTTIKKIILAI